MKPAGLEKSVGIISATPFKDGTDPQWQDTPEYKAWLAWMQKYNGSASLGDPFNVDGYIRGGDAGPRPQNGRRQPDAGKRHEAGASLNEVVPPMLLPGIALSTSASDYQPIKCSWSGSTAIPGSCSVR